MKDVPNDKKKHGAPDCSEALLEASQEDTPKQMLERGEVVVEVKEEGTEKLVSGTILLDESVEKIWPIVANPYEFSAGIYPRMRKVQVIEDDKQHSRMRCTIELGSLLPAIDAVVDSSYKTGESIDFHRVGGSLKNLTGGWTLTPREDGKTEVTFRLNIDPGIPVPGWVIRQGIKAELPNTLKAVRNRVHELHDDGKAAQHSILAAEI